MRGLRRAIVLDLVSTLATALFLATQPPSVGNELRLEWSAPVECPQAEEVRSEVDRRTVRSLRTGQPTGHGVVQLAHGVTTGERQAPRDCEMTWELAWPGARRAAAHDGRDSCPPLRASPPRGQ